MVVRSWRLFAAGFCFGMWVQTLLEKADKVCRQAEWAKVTQEPCACPDCETCGSPEIGEAKVCLNCGCTHPLGCSP
jgi:membrane protease subunit (stomatin/prohibitin family)